MLCRFLAALRNAIRAFRVMWEAQSTTPSHHGGTERSNAVKRGSAVGGSHAAPWEKPRPEKYSGSLTPNQSSVEAAPAGSASSGSGRHYAGPVLVPAADGRSERVCWVRDDDELQRLGEFHVRVVEICTQRGGCA